MPTKRTFDLIVIMWLGIELAFALPKAWAARRLTESNDGITHAIAETLTAVH